MSVGMGWDDEIGHTSWVTHGMPHASVSQIWRLCHAWMSCIYCSSTVSSTDSSIVSSTDSSTVSSTDRLLVRLLICLLVRLLIRLLFHLLIHLTLLINIVLC